MTEPIGETGETFGSLDLRRTLEKAVSRLLDQDQSLFALDVHERTIASTLASYLRSMCHNSWDVDVEYNKDGHNPKRVNLEACRSRRRGRRTGRVCPDLIVHKRNTDTNLLIVEIKKSTSSGSGEYDICKIAAYRRDLGYTYGAFLEFLAGQGAVGIRQFRWFE
jgi:hypothetical protein